MDPWHNKKRTKSNKTLMVIQINIGPYTRSDAWYFFQLTIKISLEHPLVSNTMPQPQFYSVKYPALCTALQSLGLPTNWQGDIVSVPLSRHVLNKGTTYGTQGNKLICALMYHWGSTTTTGHHLQYLIEDHKLDIGCSGYLFSKNFQYLYHSTTHYWIPQNGH